MDKKRLIVIIMFILATIVLGYGLYRAFFKKSAVVTPPPGTGVEPAPPGVLPEAGEGAPRTGEALPGTLPGQTGIQPGTAPRKGTLRLESRIVEDEVIGARTDKNGNLAFYNDADGKFYRVDQNGKVQILSDEVFYNVDNVTWSPTTDESIIEYPDGSNIYYNFQTKRQVTLPKHWESFSFTAQGSRIAAKSIGFSPENRWIVTANPDGNNVTLVAPLGEHADKVNIDWSPNNQIVGWSLTGEALGGDRQEVLFIGLNGENFKSTIVEGRGLESKWSTDGQKLLYSVYSARNDFKPDLWIVNAEGESIGTGRRLLNVETWASKCTFADARTVYCGVPTTLEEGAGFAPQIADTTPDRLVRIDVQTGIRTEIPLAESHTIRSISVSPASQSLFFTAIGEDGVFEVPL